jgi:16S rRNA (guanine527-N7)-methyltransferase
LIRTAKSGFAAMHAPANEGAGIRESIQGPADFARAFGVSRETLERLSVYEQLLGKWQGTINLVAPKTLLAVWHRHFADSAQLLALAPAKRPLRWVDLGSGAGFPGLVIGIMLAEGEGSRLALVESDTRKAAFLREVVRATGIGVRLTVDIVAERIESPANQTRVGVADVVSARALAPLAQLLGVAASYMGPESLGLFLKGRELAVEIRDAEAAFAFAFDVAASRTDASGQILAVRHLSRKS